MKRFILNLMLISVLLPAVPGCKKDPSGGVEQAYKLEAVDMGLPSGIMWSNLNLGAEAPSDLGIQLNIGLSPQTVRIVEAADDPATKELGNEWRMPTKWDFEELLRCCRTKSETVNNVRGLRIYSNVNDKSIFVPSFVYGEKHGFGLFAPSDPDYNVYYCTSCINERREVVVITPSGGSGPSLSSSERGFIRPVKAGREPVENFYLSVSPVVADPGKTVVPSVLFSPPGALDKALTLEISDTKIAEVQSDGTIFALSLGRTCLKITSLSTGESIVGELMVSDYDIPEAVDLGLPSGVKWASFDLGASDEKGAGLDYAWGETHPKIGINKGDYDDAKYDYASGSNYLAPADDAATVNLGEGWRTPSEDDFSELAANSDISYIIYEGIRGYLFESKINGRSIFFRNPPGENTVQMWTSHMSWWKGDGVKSNTFYLELDPQYAYQYVPIYSFKGVFRYKGYPVRPVFGEGRPVSSFTVTEPTVTMYLGQTAPSPVVYNQRPGEAEPHLLWESSNANAVIVSHDGTLTARNAGNSTITVRNESRGDFAKFTVKVQKPSELYPVNLGLPSGTKWGSWNVGAKNEYDPGLYLSFGESEAKDSYTRDNYKGGTADPVTALLGDHWRLPTSKELDELLSFEQQYFKSVWHTDGNGVLRRYWMIKGYQNYDLVLPAGGYKDGTELFDKDQIYYWCTSSNTKVPSWYVKDRPVGPQHDTYVIETVKPSDYPYIGMLVRPVWVD